MFSHLLKEYWAEKSVSGLLAVVSLAVLLAVSGPFGTYERLGFSARLMLWTGTVMMAVATAAVAHGLSGWVARKRGWHLMQREAFRLFLVVLLFTPIAYITVKSLGGSATGWRLSGLAKSAVYVTGFAFGARLLNAGLPPIGAGTAGQQLLSRADRADPEGPAELSAAEPNAAEPRLNRRLPGDFTGPVLRLNSKDHFVEVVSASQTVSLRMRMSDAIAEMEPVKGLVPHRSHWVSAAAVAGSLRNGARVELCLTNGDRVPVSRGSRKILEEAGVL